MDNERIINESWMDSGWWDLVTAMVKIFVWNVWVTPVHFYFLRLHIYILYIYICRSYDNGLMLICLVPNSPFLMAESSYVIPSLVQFGRLKPRKGLRDDGLWLDI